MQVLASLRYTIPAPLQSTSRETYGYIDLGPSTLPRPPVRLYGARMWECYCLKYVKIAAHLAYRWLWSGRSRLIWGVGLSSLLSFWLVRGMDWRSLGGQFEDFPVGYCLASLGIFLLATALRAFRWQVLFVGEKVPAFRLFLVQNVGSGLNSISPVRVISEVTQYVILTLRYRMQSGLAAATLGVERVLDYVINATLLGIALLALPQSHGFTLYVVGVTVIAALSVLAVPTFIWLARRPALVRVPLLVLASSSLLEVARAKVELASSLLLTLAYWLLLGLSAWVLAYAMGLGISPLVATVVVIFTLTFASVIPSLPASVGTFEFAMYYLLKPFGVSQAAALGFGLAIHAIFFLPPILIALVELCGWALDRPQPTQGRADGASLAKRKHRGLFAPRG